MVRCRCRCATAIDKSSGKTGRSLTPPGRKEICHHIRAAPKRRIAWSADQEWRVADSCGAPKANPSRHDAAPAEFPEWWDSSRWSADPCPARRSIRVAPSSGGAPGASWKFDHGLFGLRVQARQRFGATVFKHALDRIGQVFEAFFFRQALAVGFRDLCAGCNEIPFSSIDDRCKPWLHAPKPKRTLITPQLRRMNYVPMNPPTLTPPGGERRTIS